MIEMEAVERNEVWESSDVLWIKVTFKTALLKWRRTWKKRTKTKCFRSLSEQTQFHPRNKELRFRPSVNSHPRSTSAENLLPKCSFRSRLPKFTSLSLHIRILHLA